MHRITITRDVSRSGPPSLTATAANDPLRLVICPACGYSLEGLPPEGVCPECGGRYDQSAVILHGWARGDHANVYNAPPWLAGAMVVVPGLLMLHLLKDARRADGSLCPLIFISGWMAMAVVMLWRRWSAMTPGLVRVRLDASGCLQNDDPAATPDPTPMTWRAIGDVQLEESRGGSYRLQLKERRPWWRRNHAPVDAEVKLTPKQAELLRQWIDTCMRRAS